MTQPDLNSVQDYMLSAYLFLKYEEDAEEEQARFEQNLFINNPAMYNEYKKRQEEKEESGNNVTWLAPESADEVRELMDVFADIDKQLKDGLPESKGQSFISMFDGINIDELED